MINFYGTKAAKFIGEDVVRPHTPLLAAKGQPLELPAGPRTGDAIPALQAAAAVVIKPSEFTPLGIAEVVKASKDEIGGPDILDCVQGTAETLTPVGLELGGKDPMIVLSDADLDRAANAAAWGGMNSGQICISVERVYVEEPAYEGFVEKLTARGPEAGREQTGQASARRSAR